MIQTNNRLQSLFDLQHFLDVPELNDVINDTLSRYPDRQSLSDSDVEMLFAAGPTDIGDALKLRAAIPHTED